MKWSITLNDISQGGFSPKYYAETYPSFGNKNQAGAMTNCDLTNAGFITQGPGLANLTNGTEASMVTTLLKGILDFAAASSIGYGTGGSRLYQFSPTTVTNTLTVWPHTIDKATVTGESGEDVALYKEALYYVYNYTSTRGDTTTQFDITNPAGTTFRYTWDTTGTDPAITAITFPIGTSVVVNIANASAANNGTFTVTGSGANYFEVTNPLGVVESNKTIGGGSLVVLGADIGKYDLLSTFDDDWGSTVPSGAGGLIGNVPHNAIVGGNDTMYISNGRYIATYDGTTLIPRALDLPTGAEVKAIRWMSDRLWIAANVTNLTGTNKNSASLYVWDGTTDSWEAEIKLMGSVGGLHVKNGVLFTFYQDITSTGGYKMAYVNGSGVTDVASFTGALPAFYQVTDYKDFIIWVSSGDIFAFGAGDKDLPLKTFQLADGGYSTVGGLACPFGTPMVASYDGASAYKLAQFSGYDVNSSWKSTQFDITGEEKNSGINVVRINFEQLTSGTRVDWSLVDNKGTTIYSDIISYTKLGAVTTAFYSLNGKVAENFRLQFDYASGSTSATVKLKGAKIYGSTK